MGSFRQLAQRSIYADEPHFSDELLLPALVAGHHVTLVTAFLPSYLMRLVSDLAISKQIEPGKLTVVFCVPFNATEKLSHARLISNYLSVLAPNATEVRSFLDNCLKLAHDGSLRFGSLMSKESQLLTPSCCGLIESSEPSSSDMLSFIDATAGDHGSPITVSSSWELPMDQSTSVLRVVSNALNSVFPNLLRLSHEEVLDIFSEIRKKNYVRFELAETDSDSLGISEEVTAAQSSEELDSEQAWELSFDINEDLDEESYEIARILREVNLRELGFEGEDLAAFLGEPAFQEFEDFESPERQHVPPLDFEVAEWLGRGFATCWCGTTFPRESGCPERYW